MGSCVRRNDSQYPRLRSTTFSSAPPASKRSICARDIFRYLVGIGVGGVVRGQHHLRVGPEPAVRRQRLGLVDVERSAAERAVVEALQDVRLVLQAAAPGIDQHRRAERAVAIEFFKQRAIEDVPRLRCQRQQADQDVGPPQERLDLLLAVKAIDAVDGFRAPAPARDAKAEPLEHVGRVGPERAEPHDADRDRARRALRFRRPALFALRFPQVEFLPVMHQHVQHDIFRHPRGEVADRDAHQRHVGQ